MNKKQMLKEQKRLKEERRETERLFHDDKEVYNVFKILLGVILFIGIVFVFINVSNGTWNLFNKKNKAITEIDDKMLMVGTMFNKVDGEYLVLAYDMNNNNNAIYSYVASNYYGTPSLYYLDLSSGFNRNFIGDQTVISDELTNLKFGGPTLLLINKDKITKSFITEDEIINYLNK